MKRRELLKQALWGGILLSFPAIGFGQTETKDYKDFDGPLPNYRLYGPDPVIGKEEVKARTILENSPSSPSLLSIGTYFENITESNDNGELYNAQWAKRWNPMIVGFYQSPEIGRELIYRKGDTVPWCAAFLNWCLARAGYETTGKAISGSFRLGKGLGAPTGNPTVGDVIVFRNRNEEEAAVGFGQVGIFIDQDTGGYRVLGGNHKQGRMYSCINTAYIAKNHPTLEFSSIRALSSIPRVR